MDISNLFNCIISTGNTLPLSSFTPLFFYIPPFLPLFPFLSSLLPYISLLLPPSLPLSLSLPPSFSFPPLLSTLCLYTLPLSSYTPLPFPFLFMPIKYITTYMYSTVTINMYTTASCYCNFPHATSTQRGGGSGSDGREWTEGRGSAPCRPPHGFHDNSSTDISSTNVYRCTGQIYIQLLFQQIIIFINSNFYLHYDSFLSIPLPLTL